MQPQGDCCACVACAREWLGDKAFQQTVKVCKRYAKERQVCVHSLDAVCRSYQQGACPKD